MKEAFRERVLRAAGSLSHLPRVDAAVILGSGLGQLADGVNGTEIPYSQISGFPVPTVSGHQGLLKIIEVEGVSQKIKVALMAGRFHFYEGCTMDDVAMPVFLLSQLGAKRLVVTNAAGAVNEEFVPGDLVLLKDHLNLIGTNPLIGPAIAEWGPRFPDMSYPYSPALRRLAQAASPDTLHEGVYAALSGPTFETPAEIRMLRTLGADLVGMSTVPEVIAARFLGIEVLGISCVTNMAAGILDQPLTHAEVMETGRMVAQDFASLIMAFLSSL